MFTEWVAVPWAEGDLNSTQLEILPLCVIMIMGPQILTAIFLITSGETVRNSVAMLLGVAIAASLELVAWYYAGSAVGIKPHPDAGPSTSDHVVAALLALLAVRVWVHRGKAEVPKWMRALQEAEPKRAFALGFVLILLMPGDIAATITAVNHLHTADLAAADGWPLVAGTLLLMSLPLLAYLAFGRRAREAMPEIRAWLTTHSWLVNLVVIAYFIFQLAT